MTTKIPKCPKTVTGEHKFYTPKWYIDGQDPFPELPRCILCGLIDDRELKIDKKI